VTQTRTEQQGKHFRENALSGGEKSSVQIRKGRSTRIVKEGRSNQEHEEGAIIKNQQITYLSSEVPYAVAGAKFNQTSPPYYPSPWGTGAGEWAGAYEKARAFVSQLTLAEKVNLTTGTFIP